MNLHKNLLLIFMAVVTQSACRSNENSGSPERPNIIIILADDLGFSDLGCYGGEIQTPNLDALAANGIRYTQMYNTARCCPTRASLMTGKYQHLVGMASNGHSLDKDSPTLAEILALGGYHTGMAGKWHLSETKPVQPQMEQLKWLAHQTDYGPFANVETYPCNRGFEEHWGVIWGVVNYFDPFSLVHNEEPITEVHEDFYMTDFITEKSLDMIEQFSSDDKNPFFLYVAHTAPHWPLHARPEDIVKYRDMYTEGWGKLREDRYRRLLEIGLIDKEHYPLPGNSSGKSWEDCEEKQKEANHMAVHAAMVDRLDQGVGQIIKKLKEEDEFDNTVIFFLADNGAAPEYGFPPGFDRPGFTRDGMKIDYDPKQPGSELTWGYIGDAWASALNTPWRYWKMQSYEGGIHTPFILHWPEGLKGAENTINQKVGHVMDLLPTCLELSGMEYPEYFNGKKTTLPNGKSLIPFTNQEIATPHDTLFWEHYGGRAVRIGDWKMVSLNDWFRYYSDQGKAWQLFDLSVDRTEMNDLAAQEPERVKSMNTLWEEWARKMEIIE